MSQSLISIIVPIYKVEKYLDKCVESLICQTYENIEIILVDDGSPDNCPKMCDEWAKKDNRIKVIHKKNGGLSDARNAGIDAALGDYIMFTDSDDYVRDDMVSVLYTRIKEDKSDMAICNLSYVDENGREIESIEPLKAENKVVDEAAFWNDLYNDKHTYCVVAWNKLYAKKLFDGVRYEVGKLHEDEFIIHKLVSKCDKISFSDEKCCYYLQRENSIMADNYSVKRLDVVEAIIDRSLYFYNKGWQALSEKAFINVIGALLLGYEKLDLTDSKAKSKLEEAYALYRKTYKVIASSKNSSMKFKINGLSFYLSPKLYKAMHSTIK